CEPTRVREGLRFELRCRETARPAAGLLCQAASCFGDPAELKGIVADLTVLDHAIRMSEEEVALERQGGTYNGADVQAGTDARHKAVQDAGDKPDGAALRRIAGKAAALAVYLGGFQPAGGTPPPATPKEITDAGQALDAASRKIVDNI